MHAVSESISDATLNKPITGRVLNDPGARVQARQEEMTGKILEVCNFAAGEVAPSVRLPRVRLCERRQQTRRQCRHLQPALSDGSLEPGVYRLHRPAKHHQP